MRHEGTMKKKDGVKISEEDIRNRGVPKLLSWESASQEMTEEELEKIRNMNWEWYYNCYLYLDEIIPISCKRCSHINVFQPGEKMKICENCGAHSKRCEKEEEL